MSDAASLMQNLLGPAFSEDDVETLLEQALCSEVDPLHWCAVHFGISQAELMRRAAVWLGLDYSPAVPRGGLDPIAPPRLELLAEVRMFRLRVDDRDVALASPDYFGILRLKRAYRVNPALRQRLCLVPAAALRELIVECAGEALIDGARQTLARS